MSNQGHKKNRKGYEQERVFFSSFSITPMIFMFCNASPQRDFFETILRKAFCPEHEGIRDR
jgi:hypothetical protein